MSAAATDAARLPEGFVRLVASSRLRSDPATVARLLDSGDLPWADASLEQPEAEHLRRFAVDLRLRLGDDSMGFTTFSKAAYLDLGRSRRTPAGLEAEIGWRASTAAPLFPVFAGRLRIGPEELRIEGVYAPPGGVVGRLADRMLLHVAANATARWVLTEIDHTALGAAA